MLNTFLEHRMEDCETSNPQNSRLKPASVLVYNKTMGALDSMDQIIRPNQSLRKTFKWYRKYAFHLFDMCVYNSWVICNHVKRNAKNTIFKDYVLALIEQIIVENPIERSSKGRRPSKVQLNSSNNSNHFPSTSRGNDGKKLRGNCHFCWKNLNKKRKMTSIKCCTCGLWLCADGDVSCFKKYHDSR